MKSRSGTSSQFRLPNENADKDRLYLEVGSLRSCCEDAEVVLLRDTFPVDSSEVCLNATRSTLWSDCRCDVGMTAGRLLLIPVTHLVRILTFSLPVPLTRCLFRLETNASSTSTRHSSSCTFHRLGHIINSERLCRLQLVVWLVPSLIANAIAESFVGMFLGPIYPTSINVAASILPAWCAYSPYLSRCEMLTLFAKVVGGLNRLHRGIRTSRVRPFPLYDR